MVWNKNYSTEVPKFLKYLSIHTSTYTSTYTQYTHKHTHPHTQQTCAYMRCAKLRWTLCYPMDCSQGLLCPWNSSGKNTGVGCHTLLQGILLTQGSNPHLLYLVNWQADSLPPASPVKTPQDALEKEMATSSSILPRQSHW